MDCALQSGHARICLTLDLAIDTKHNKKQQCQCYVTSSHSDGHALTENFMG
jgi:hypothetical protein